MDLVDQGDDALLENPNYSKYWTFLELYFTSFQNLFALSIFKSSTEYLAQKSSSNFEQNGRFIKVIRKTC